MLYLSKDVIEVIKEMPEDGYLKINMEKDINTDMKLSKYMWLKNFGMAFMKIIKDDAIIHIPEIKQMKKLLNDKEIMKFNKEFNEQMDIIVGMSEIHGAVKYSDIAIFLQKQYTHLTKEEFEKNIILTGVVHSKVNIKIDFNAQKIKYIAHSLVEENEAKAILKANETIEFKTKEEYLKYSSDNFMSELKGYKTIVKAFGIEDILNEDVIRILNDMLFPFVMEVRLESEKAEKIEKEMIDEIVININELFEETEIDIKKLKQGFKQIREELPKWK